MQPYTTLAGYGTDEFVEKRSRFIGYAAPVTTEAEAVDFIARIRALHREASHNVYAYALREGQVRRYSDDGEPQGTAGVPVLDVLQKQEIVDAVVVVTRYFGGTLLGAGGLVRATPRELPSPCGRPGPGGCSPAPCWSSASSIRSTAG